MRRPEVEARRRESLSEAAIAEIGARGSLDVTVGQIARRAGVSSALAHHYFGTKDQLFLAAMRHILRAYGAEVRRRLAAARTPRARLEAIVHASFAAPNFRAEVVSAWLTFYLRAQTSAPAARLLTLYRRRLRSNLVAALRPLGARDPDAAAEAAAALIDGLYVRAAVGNAGPADPAALVLAHLDALPGVRA